MSGKGGRKMSVWDRGALYCHGGLMTQDEDLAVSSNGSQPLGTTCPHTDHSNHDLSPSRPIRVYLEKLLLFLLCWRPC